MNYTNIIFEKTQETSFASWREKLDISESLSGSALVKLNVAGALDSFIEFCL